MLFIFDNILSFQTVVGEIDGEEEYALVKHEEVMVKENRDQLRPNKTKMNYLMNNCVPLQKDDELTTQNIDTCPYLVIMIPALVCILD